MPLNTNHIICKDCKRLFKKVQSGIKIQVESMSGVQNGDLYECPSCGFPLLTQFGGEYGFNKVEPDIYMEKV